LDLLGCVSLPAATAATAAGGAIQIEWKPLTLAASTTLHATQQNNKPTPDVQPPKKLQQANDAAKKRVIRLRNIKALYSKIMLGLYAAYFLLRIVWQWHTFTVWPHWFALALLSIVNVLGSRYIYENIAQGFEVEYVPINYRPAFVPPSARAHRAAPLNCSSSVSSSLSSSSSLQTNINNNNSGTIAQDALWLNWGVMVLSTMSGWFWLLYLLLPASLLYRFGPMLSGFCCNRGGPGGGDAEQERVLTPAEQKRADKKARKANRVRYKRGR
jgi:hypothetical protein